MDAVELQQIYMYHSTKFWQSWKGIWKIEELPDLVEGEVEVNHVPLVVKMLLH